jgi:RND superfamily putative drug exporter
MVALGRFSIRRPKLALTFWALIAAVLVVIGFGISNSLSPTITVVPGTQSSRAQQLADAHFGPSQLVPILLQGPAAQLDRQGPALVRALSSRAKTRVMSAWDGGAVTETLRKSPTAAMIIAAVNRPEKDVVRYDQAQIESAVSRYIKSPVRAYVTGQPAIDRAEKKASLDNLRRNELIAIGIMFVLLLAGLRAPVAALLVAAVGAVSTLAAFGLVALIGHVMTVDPVGVAGCTMAGLALATGFALLILDRFHREQGPEGDPAMAAVVSLETTGKAVLVAGTALVITLLVVSVIGPTALMNSIGTGTLVCALFAIGGTVVVMPAALVLLGRHVDAFRFPAPAPLARAWQSLVKAGNIVTRYAIFAGFFATLVLAALAVPAFSLKSGPSSIKQLPANSPARIAFERINQVMGAGFATPYDLIITPRNVPVTDPRFLAAVSKLQQEIMNTGQVAQVTGPGAVYATAQQLAGFEPGLNKSAAISDKSKKDLVRLIAGLKQAGAGTVELSTKLQAAASGASQIHSGSGTAQSGAGTLHSYLMQAEAGSAKVNAGLAQALGGAVALKSGASQALAGASTLAAGLGKGAPQVKAGLPAVSTLASDSAAAVNQIKTAQGQAAGAQGSLGRALSALQGMTTGKSDPRYAAALSELQSASGSVNDLTSGLGSAETSAGGAAFIASGVKSQINLLSPQLSLAAAGASKLADGIKQLRDGNASLAGGLRQLAAGGGQLHGGLGQLVTGAGQLQTGLGVLNNGTGQLAAGLAGAPGGVGQLTTGIGAMRAAVTKSRSQIPSTASLKQLEAQSPGLFSSGYFVLAALAGAPATQRTDAGFTLNLLRGGTAGQLAVVPKFSSNDPRTLALGATLVKLAQRFAKNNDAQVAVGGPEGSLGDLTNATKSKIWLDVAILAAAIVLTLGIALRAVVLPIAATLFSLLVAASTFGALQLLFGGSDPLLGGPGYLDPMTIISVFTISFSITVVFATVLLMRTREACADESPADALRTGMRETAAATTGAGALMVGAVIPFVTTGMINIRVLGVGIVIAVLLDIVIVRPLLLPAAVAVFGRGGWWPTASAMPPAASRPKRRPATASPSIGA